IASPSAPTCDVTATRPRVFKNSATSGVELFFVRVFIRPHLPQSALYPVCPLHDRVRLETQPGCPLQPRLRPQGGLDAPGRALQALLGLLGALSQDAVEDRRVRQVRAHADAGNRDEAPD